MKKTLIILYSILVASPCFAQYTNEYPLTMEQPRFSPDGYHQPKYQQKCVDAEGKMTCYYERSHGVSEKETISGYFSVMDKNGKIIKKVQDKDKIIIRPQYLNLNGKPMNKEELAELKRLFDVSAKEAKESEEKRKNENDFVKQWF